MSEELKEFCKVCERVPFGDIVRLGHGTWRHDECQIGSEAWAEYFAKLPAKEKANLTDLYRGFIGVSVHYTTEGVKP